MRKPVSSLEVLSADHVDDCVCKRISHHLNDVHGGSVRAEDERHTSGMGKGAVGHRQRTQASSVLLQVIPDVFDSRWNVAWGAEKCVIGQNGVEMDFLG